MTVRVGLCGFTIGAKSYAKRFPVVEVQQTFYDPPRLDVVRGWRERVPDPLEFTMKAWQAITHDGDSRTYRRMRRPMSEDDRRSLGSFRDSDVVRRAWEETRACATALGATAVLFQCPPRFRPTAENAANLVRFFAEVAVPRDPGTAFLWEPRGAWPQELVRDLCAQAGLVHAVDPFLGPPATAGFTYFRLHGLGRERHRHAYADAELVALRDLLPEAARCGDERAYVMFNNVPRVADATRFAALLAAR
jgi:uncharacterized protein YecE (DUF72 family)